MPRPEPQREIFGPDGRLIARVDFYWEEQKTVGEFDGKIKYGRLLKPGKRIEDVIFEEKVREDAVRDLACRLSDGCGPTSIEPESYVNEYFVLSRAHLDATRHCFLGLGTVCS